MVSPSDNWEEREDGYELGDTSVLVQEIEGRYSEGGEMTEYTGYSVIVYMGPTGHASPQEIATYESPREAWELAHILTHYFDEWNSKLDLNNLHNGQDGGEVLPPRGLAERDPEQLLRDGLGHYEYKLDEVLP